ncbi:hypothetical protein LOK49_LG11G02701 [Camellia lanceoleosa]|uniref:Uncharacterized protein n=1 Tax=Camellia lanceoleosa TaxID=1840588 RepID=A0ACC0FYB8_9ERIC|nr:hypothetical protein LOK49_LG11G02701 [Camellia lanceoleosa]
MDSISIGWNLDTRLSLAASIFPTIEALKLTQMGMCCFRLPNIGQIFPDSNPKWKGAASSVFIKEAYGSNHVRLMDKAGYELGNLDATLIFQRPKLSPHEETIRANLSKLLGADPSVVNLKAKSLGENRSIAAHTVVLLMRKYEGPFQI